MQVNSIQTQPLRAYPTDPCTPAGRGEKTRRQNGPTSPARGDTVEISPEARKRLAGMDAADKLQEKTLTQQEEKEVKDLEKRDSEVKSHEMAHVVAGGGTVMGGAHYTYQMGPDGKRYAVGGHVNIDTSGEEEPESTIRKMQQVKKAALAPAQPSASDKAVAAAAAMAEMKARAEMYKENQEKLQNTSSLSGAEENPQETAAESSARGPGGIETM